ncbi:MAG: ABC transporter permease [Tannerellaceae bacterium]|nr:ABC transporter permease [Tannerellaceae bacterium]
MWNKFIFRIALRNLRKNRQSTLISIAGLVTGIICFTCCSYCIRQISNINSSFPTFRQMHALVLKTNEGRRVNNTIEYAEKLEKAMIPGIESVSFYTYPVKDLFTGITDSGEERSYLQNYITVNQAFFDVFPTHWLRKAPGDLFSLPNTVILSAPAAEYFFGKENPVGQALLHTSLQQTEEPERYTVRGIVEEFPPSNSISPFQPLGIFICRNDHLPPTTQGEIIVTGTSGVSTQTLNERLKDAATLFPGENIDMSLVNAYEQSQNSINKIALLLLYGLSFLILLVALINFFSITIGHFYNRTKELSVRKELGATIYDPFIQLFTETALVVLIAFLLSFPATELFLLFLKRHLLSSHDIYIHSRTLYRQQIEYLPLILAICAGMAAIASWRIHRLGVIKGIKGGSRDGTKHRFRNSMLVIQLIISIFFLGTGMAFKKQFHEISQTVFPSIPKAEKRQILEVRLDFPYIIDHKALIMERLSSFNQIEEILGARYPLQELPRFNALLSGQDTLKQVRLNLFTPNFSSFLHLEKTAGSFPNHPNEVIINPSIREFITGKGSVSTFYLDKEPYRITGVMEHTTGNRDYRTTYGILPEEEYPSVLYIKPRKGEEKKTYEMILLLFREWIPGSIPYSIPTLETVLEAHSAGEKAAATVFTWLATLSILITSLGIYSSITTDTLQRQKEVAIRKINGAYLKNILWLFGKLYLKLLVIASLFGLPPTWLFAKFISEISHLPCNYNDPFIWCGILVILTAILGITISYRLYRTARINPAEVIKYE